MKYVIDAFKAPHIMYW